MSRPRKVMNHRAKRISRRATGTKKSGAKKFIHGLWRWLGEQLWGREFIGKRRKRKISFPPPADFFCPPDSRFRILISFNRCNWRTMVFTCQWNLTLRRNRSCKIWNFSTSFWGNLFITKVFLFVVMKEYIDTIYLKSSFKWYKGRTMVIIYR